MLRAEARHERQAHGHDAEQPERQDQPAPAEVRHLRRDHETDESEAGPHRLAAEHPIRRVAEVGLGDRRGRQDHDEAEHHEHGDDAGDRVVRAGRRTEHLGTGRPALGSDPMPRRARASAGVCRCALRSAVDVPATQERRSTVPDEALRWTGAAASTGSPCRRSSARRVDGRADGQRCGHARPPWLWCGVVRCGGRNGGWCVRLGRRVRRRATRKWSPRASKLAYWSKLAHPGDSSTVSPGSARRPLRVGPPRRGRTRRRPASVDASRPTERLGQRGTGGADRDHCRPGRARPAIGDRSTPLS